MKKGRSYLFSKKRNKGITLIALIITIIVLLILAGITLSLTIGENGIIKKAQESRIAYEEQSAREKLELVLLDIQADKTLDTSYDENEYINIKIEQNEMTVEDDIVLVEGWQFQIDRSVPKIVANLGKKGYSIMIGTSYVGTRAFTTKILSVSNEEDIESYVYIIDGTEEVTNSVKEYTKEGLEPETTHTVKIVARCKNGSTIESNRVTIKTEPRTYLYHNRDQCVNITGGWEAVGAICEEFSTSYPPAMEETEEGLYAYLESSDYGGRYGLTGAITIRNSIDYSKYKSVHIIYSASLGKYSGAAEITLRAKNHEEVFDGMDERSVVICYEEPIQKREDSFLIEKYGQFDDLGIYMQSHKHDAWADLTIHEMWLEK